jgi:hypothetical protein
VKLRLKSTRFPYLGIASRERPHNRARPIHGQNSEELTTHAHCQSHAIRLRLDTPERFIPYHNKSNKRWSQRVSARQAKDPTRHHCHKSKNFVADASADHDRHQPGPDLSNDASLDM